MVEPVDDAQSLFECRRFAAQLAIERQHLSDALDGVREVERRAAQREVALAVEAMAQERDQAVVERDRAVVEREIAVAERDRAISERDRARAEAHDATARLMHVTSSTAWRVTGPVRRVLQALLGR